jgi:hypothetical protein
MGTKVSMERPQKPRLRSLSSSRDDKKPLLNSSIADAGSTVGELDKHSRFDFEDYSLSEEKKQPKRPLLIQSSPSTLDRSERSDVRAYRKVTR